jgi:hypothetical protein
MQNMDMIIFKKKRFVAKLLLMSVVYFLSPSTPTVVPLRIAQALKTRYDRDNEDV